MITPAGNIFYQDDYGTNYIVEWETVGTDLEITCQVEQPFVWGEQPRGYVRNHRLYRYGLVTITRQVFRGNEIIAEGVAQYYDFVQANFVCETTPVDNFRYHVNYVPADDTEFRVSDGLQYTDPDVPYSDSVWGDVQPDGTPIVGTFPALEWMDVWT